MKLFIEFHLPKVDLPFVENRLDYILTEVLNLCVYAALFAILIGGVMLLWVTP